MDTPAAPTVQDILFTLGVPEDEVEKAVQTVSAIAMLRALDDYAGGLSAELQDELKVMPLDKLTAFLTAHASELPKIDAQKFEAVVKDVWREYVSTLAGA